VVVVEAEPAVIVEVGQRATLSMGVAQGRAQETALIVAKQLGPVSAE
jgi:hypothetical protein